MMSYESRDMLDVLTIPSLSANFLLIGRVSLLTSVPSGYKMKVRGVCLVCASLPNHASELARCSRSAAQERLKKMNL